MKVREIHGQIQACYHGKIQGNKSNPKRMRKIINTFRNNSPQSTISSNSDITGNKSTQESSISESLNQNFIVVGARPAETIEQLANHDTL